MINRIKLLFSNNIQEAEGSEIGKLEAASAALLVEAACMDGNFDEKEREKIVSLMQANFGLNNEESETLVNETQSVMEQTGDLYSFTRVIKNRFDQQERIQMIEMLWEVAFADGNVDYYESNLISRIAGLIYVNDIDRGEAKKRVMARLGFV
ncbi:MAG: TerB family tellurite resistance protein [Rhodospirillales bacterium]|nr:TerB family tellurite resistance protein [Rhodospirillales bacterium]